MDLPGTLDHLRVRPKSPAHLHRIDPGSREGAPGDKKATEVASLALNRELAELQERLWAENQRSLLVVLQAMDAGGKDGAIRRVFGGVNPQGCRVTSFKAPSEEELAHDFLWRINKATPRKGEIAIFNRSHYEDVLIVRVHDLVPKSVWSKRYAIINSFEANLAASGTTIVKFFLHISKKEQAERFRKRLENPEKHWKFRLADLEERKHWDDYQTAFEDALSKTSTTVAPWHVIPADSKWYRDWALLSVLVETLRAMDPQFPPPEEDLTGIVVE
ncbi:MAG TPA: polyphosphate kinase 2 family protein [Acidimicrobiales bacterium]|nr:polyphosphate kinase 2 family protein [Acidimicrobiales bacterium]